MEKYITIAKENFKHNLPFPLFLCAVLLLLSPLFLGLKNLTEPESAKVVEQYLVFLGLVLLPSVFLAEQNQEIWDVVRSKYFPMQLIYGLRLLQALLGGMCFLGLYLLAMQSGNCRFSFPKLYFGALGGMVFFGGLAVFVYALTNQVVLGYMASILYYVLCMGNGKDKVGVFYLFSMTEGQYSWKCFQAAAGFLLLLVGVAVRMRRGRN